MANREEIGIFGDYENCPVPAKVEGCSIVDSIIKSIGKCKVTAFKAYSCEPIKEQVGSQLQSSGVTLVNCPQNKNKDTADHMMMVDMVVHGMLNPCSTIVAITGDRDFAYALATLKLHGHRIVLISHGNGHQSIKVKADKFINWKHEILGNSPRTMSPEPCLEEESEEEYEEDYEEEYEQESEEEFILHTGFAVCVSDVDDSWDGIPESSPPTSPEPQSASGSPSMYNTHPPRDDYPSSPIFAGRSKHTTIVDLPRSPAKASRHNTSPAVAQATKEDTRDIFHVLIKVLNDRAELMDFIPLRSVVGSRMSLSVYRKAGVENFREYTALAEQKGVVTLGGAGGSAWMLLAPQYRK